MTRFILMLGLAFWFCAAGAALHAAEADETKAKAAFEQGYEAGALAVTQKKWSVAEKEFDKALKALGELDHPNKPVAKLLLGKAKEMAKQEEGLHVADELLKLKQWAEAEAAYRKAAEVLGDTETVRQGIAAAQAGAKAEKQTADARTSTTGVKEPAPEKPATTAKKEPEPLELPAPVELRRDDWEKSGGSACYWAGERLFLEEGDELYRKVLKGDFAASIAIEAEMNHRSSIRIELRPVKDSGSKTKITGWGSKAGSAPYLEVEKDVKATGDKQPAQQQITLSFIRTGTKIEFYCDGKAIGHTWDAKVDQPYHLWVCGKGIMNGAKIVER